MKLRTGNLSPLRRAVNACLAASLVLLPACAKSARPANWVLQAEGWSLPPRLQAYDRPCKPTETFPPWVLKARGGHYGSSDYAFLGVGEGTVDLAPRRYRSNAERYDMRPVKGEHPLAGIATPLARELSPEGESLAHVRMFIRGGGTIDAKWVVRGGLEARGVDLLGEPFRVPEDNIGLVQGRQAVAGLGVGRVGLRITDQFDESRVYYGLNAAYAHEREAAAALSSHGFVRVPADELIRVDLPGRRLFGVPALLGGLLGGAPIGYAFTVPAALLVSLKSVLLAPVSRPVAGARVRSAPYGEPAEIGESGIEGDLLWIAVRPPRRSELLWLVPPESVRIEWSRGGADQVFPALTSRGDPIPGPALLDPGAGTRFYFRVHDLPTRFDLVIDDPRTLDGTASGPWVYNMKRRTRVRWNPVSVWREWKCE